MKSILFQSIEVDDFKKIISDVIDEKLKILPITAKEEKSDLLSREEVAKMLKISLPTLNDWSKKGLVQSYRIGNRVLYKLHEILDSIKQVKNLKYRRA
jgi:excisionase family DNA binding protein